MEINWAEITEVEIDWGDQLGSGRHLGGIWGASGRHLGGIWGLGVAMGGERGVGVKVCQIHCVFLS